MGRLLGAQQEIEVVDDRLHPGAHLFLQVTGQKADVLAERDHRSGHQQTVVEGFIGHLVEAGGEGEQGLARARLAHQGEELNGGIEQQIEGEGLLPVPCAHPAQLDPPPFCSGRRLAAGAQ